MKKIRGVWLTNVDSTVLDSKERIVEAMQFLADTGFNVVFPVVWNKGYTLYRSQIMQDIFGAKFAIDPKYQQQGREPLLEVIAAAKQAQMKVIPWFEYGFAYSHQSLNNPQKLIFETKLKQLGWLAYDQDGKPLAKNGFQWLNALLPEVQDFMLNLILELVKNYDIDGIQGDDRLPALPSEGGYDSATQQLFRQQFNKQPPLNHKDKLWLQWRADMLTNFLEQLYTKVKATKQELTFSMAPHPFNFGWREYLQDWKTWLNRGLIDTLHPQLYRRDFNSYKNLCQETISQLKSNQISQLAPGILIQVGSFRINPIILWDMIQYHRQHGINGEVFFFYEGLRANNNELAKFLQQKKYQNS
ncbi:MAG: family 10 glycosylhydrolase [Gomphosphaeria aponina SAG 52.96 = DSM 107014]|uniref:Family 10 glycosylhydrolase n=1 Tax=Gomphosphaeria aponina SAG 52.96 = DSM 107014 TaxID=1521640 RepID=A0A941GSI4_9CHRO|nr:family 10 glycosylhydrolase [Gomphosphaeria aponina SAG 52.96 = DSM 107014]